MKYFKKSRFFVFVFFSSRVSSSSSSSSSGNKAKKQSGKDFLMIIIRHVVFEISAASYILFLVALFFPGLCFFIYTECFFSPLLFDYVIGAGLLYEYIYIYIFKYSIDCALFLPIFPPLYI